MKEYLLTNAELAILSLIAEHPRHGYEIESVITERGMRDWTDVAFSSIYFILNNLVKKGLAVSSLQPAAGRGPAKKVFSVTSEGHSTLHQGIYQCISEANHDDRSFLLGLSCLPLLSRKEVEAAFEHRIAFLHAKVTEFTCHPVMQHPDFPLHVHAMFDYSLAIIRAELDWTTHFLESYLLGETQNGKTGSQKTI